MRQCSSIADRVCANSRTPDIGKACRLILRQPGRVLRRIVYLLQRTNRFTGTCICDWGLISCGCVGRDIAGLENSNIYYNAQIDLQARAFVTGD